jgi:hypothetical protein
VALKITTKDNIDIHEMDLCTAFVGVALPEDIYIHPPQGFFGLLQTER